MVADHQGGRDQGRVKTASNRPTSHSLGPRQKLSLAPARLVTLMSFVKPRGHGCNFLHARQREVD
jgi:hypothetical protein